MPSAIDPALLRALALDPSSASLTTYGGSGFASTLRITTPTRSIFVKTAAGADAGVMFEGEHASLNAIHGVVPSLCPESFAWGRLEGGGYFLATEFLDLGGGGGGGGRRAKVGGEGGGMTLAQKLARLHTTTAPVPQGYERVMFGFPVTTCCGDTPQDNGFEESWAEFFGKRRLRAILERGEKRNGKDGELRAVVERTVDEVVPRLLGDGHLGGKDGIKPVVVHGDLWSGNHGRGRFVGRGGADADEPGPVEEVVFDASACYAHSEYELGIMQMFGGYAGMMNEYYALVPKTHPAEEHGDGVSLYESYHHLNHYAIFGGSYKSGAMSILKRLVKKYADESL